MLYSKQLANLGYLVLFFAYVTGSDMFLGSYMTHLLLYIGNESLYNV